MTWIQRIDKWLTIRKCVWILYFLVFGLACPIPAKWNAVLDSMGGTVEDYMWYFSYYGVLTLLLYMVYKITDNLGIKLLYLLGCGKLIDQIFHPYEYHSVELIWDVTAVVYIIYELWKSRKQVY